MTKCDVTGVLLQSFIYMLYHSVFVLGWLRVIYFALITVQRSGFNSRSGLSVFFFQNIFWKIYMFIQAYCPTFLKPIKKVFLVLYSTWVLWCWCVPTGGAASPLLSSITGEFRAEGSFIHSIHSVSVRDLSLQPFKLGLPWLCGASLAGQTVF